MKDNCINWIGKIPSNWMIRKMKYCGQLDSNGVDKKQREGEKLYKSVHYMDVYKNSLHEIENNENYLVISADDKKAKHCALKAGDVLFTTSSENPEDIGHSVVILKDLDETLFGYHLMRFRAEIPLDLHYRKYLFGSYLMRQWFEFRAVGITRYGLSREDSAEAQLFLPPFEVQHSIASFLDTKTTLIDDLIEKERTIITRLKEYKQAVITEAVTKGITPDVPMKDSGVEWIGEIPEGWIIRKMKYCGQLDSNGVDKKQREGEKLYKSVHYMDVYKNSLHEIENNENYLIISANDKKAKHCALKAGDVLFTTSSENPEDIGHSVVISKDLDETLFGYHLMRFRAEIPLDLHFRKYLFGSYLMRQWFEFRAVGITRYGLSREDSAEAQLFLPPFEVQHSIASYLDEKCTSIESAIEKKELLIQKLTEYKKSLIYEAVTGKIEITDMNNKKSLGLSNG